MRGLLCGAALWAAAGALGAQAFEPASTLLPVIDENTRLALRDVDGDGRLDLLAVGLAGISLRRLGADGRYPEDHDAVVPWPGETVGWFLADVDGDGDTEVALLIGGTRVALVDHDAERGFALGPDLVVAPTGFLPRGVRRVNFVRDVDGDGRADFVVPAAGRFLIHLQREGGWGAPLPVRFQASITLETGDPEALDSRFRSDVKIPWFTLEDIDGDGRIDLVSETDDEAQFHLAGPELPAEPSFSLDLAALRAELPPKGQINLDNLLANVDPRVGWRVAELDGEAPADLVVQQGGKISLYLGGSRGPRLEAPDQVLKASGNVLYFLLRDANGDTLPDLQLLRAATISLGDALRLLVVPGSIDFDVFTYNNEGGEFARKPSVRTTLALRVPALLSFLDDVKQMREEYEERSAVPAQAACLDGDGLVNDVVDVRDGALLVWRDRVASAPGGGLIEALSSFDPDELLEQYALSRLDELSDGGVMSIELKDIRKLLVTPGWDLREQLGERAPDARWPLGFAGLEARLRIEDLDGDGRDDVIVAGLGEAREQMVQLFVTRGPDR